MFFPLKSKMEAYRNDKKWAQLAKWSHEMGIPSWSARVVRMSSIHPGILMGSRLSAQSIIDGESLSDQDGTEHRDGKRFHILCVARMQTCGFCQHSNRFHSVIIRDRDASTNIEFLKNAQVAASLLFRLLQGGNTVLVHCHSGRNRSALVILVYCAMYTSLSFDASLYRIKNYNSRRFSRKDTLSNRSFVTKVKENWEDLRNEANSSSSRRRRTLF